MATDYALFAAITYFAAFGVAFLIRPALVGSFGLQWADDAGRAEVRCYYGAVSVALAAFLTYLRAQDLTVEALTGVTFLAGAVFVVRVITATIDRSWSAPYNRLALPVEALFVFGLVVTLAFG